MEKVTLANVLHIDRGNSWEVYGKPKSEFRRIIRHFVWKNECCRIAAKSIGDTRGDVQRWCWGYFRRIIRVFGRKISSPRLT